VAASRVAGVVGGASPGSQLGSLPETTPRSSLGSTPISSPQRKLESPAWQATGVTWGYPSFRWGDGLGVRCDSLLSVLAVSRQVSTVHRPPSAVSRSVSGFTRGAFSVRHFADGIRPVACGPERGSRHQRASISAKSLDFPGNTPQTARIESDLHRNSPRSDARNSSQFRPIPKNPVASPDLYGRWRLIQGHVHR
jgi:hypothetical protein